MNTIEIQDREECQLMKGKRILWVSHDFPPRKTSGMYRPIKIYKYINKDALEIEFLTQRNFIKSPVADNHLIEELDPIPKIYRLPNVVFDDMIDVVRNTANKIFARRSVASGKDTPAPCNGSPCEPGNPDRSFLKKLYRLFMMTFYFPDEFVIWGFFSAIKAVLLNTRKGYDIVYTTSHPQSGHLAGLMLKIMGVKWVVDYRDGGILWQKQLLGYTKGRIREWAEFHYQKYVLHKADHVIIHTRGLREQFCKEFGIAFSKMTEIHNGYDEEDFVADRSEPVPFSSKSREIHMLHMGTSYIDNEEVSKVVKALNRLNALLKIRGQRLFFHSVGHDILRHYRMGKMLEFEYVSHDVIPHKQVVNYLEAADCYLLCATKNPGFIPAKIWEYLRSAKPVIFYGLKDEAWRILNQENNGYYIELNGDISFDADKLVDDVEMAMFPKETLGRFSWRARANAFSEVFLNVCDA